MDSRNLINEVKVFLLELTDLPVGLERKRIDLVGRLEIWLHKASVLGDKEPSSQRNGVNYVDRASQITKQSHLSYESLKSEREGYISSIYDEEVTKTDESSELNNGSNEDCLGSPPQANRVQLIEGCSASLPDCCMPEKEEYEGRSRTSGLISAYSYINLNPSDAKHTGRLSPALNLLRKAVTKPQYYYASLFSDRLILLKSLKDAKPFHEIRFQPGCSVERQGKTGIRVNEVTGSGKILSHSFTCQYTTEASTWVDIISEVIQKLRDSHYQSCESKSIDDSILLTGPSNTATAAPWRKTSPSPSKSARKFLRRLSKDIRNASPKSSQSESPHGPVWEDDTIRGDLLVKFPGGSEREARYCVVKNGIFSVYLTSKSAEPEMTFPLQCCELVHDPDATSKDLRFRIVQGNFDKLSCEALDCISHIRWLKYLSETTSVCGSTVPAHLLALAPGCNHATSHKGQPRMRVYVKPTRKENEYMEEPFDDEDCYQIPISLTRFNPGMRHTLESIRQSLTDEGALASAAESEVGRSQQDLHSRSSSSSTVKRSLSTRPLYNAEARQTLSAKACHRLLPDIERCLARTEERLQEGTSECSFDDYNSAPASPATPRAPLPCAPVEASKPHEAAIYVEATPLPSKPPLSVRSSRSNYSSASASRYTEYSSDSAERGTADDDDGLILSTSHYGRSPNDAVSALSDDLVVEENIYEYVDIPDTVVQHVATSKSVTDGRGRKSEETKIPKVRSRASRCSSVKEKIGVRDSPAMSKAFIQDLSSAVRARSRSVTNDDAKKGKPEEQEAQPSLSKPATPGEGRPQVSLPKSSSAELLATEAEEKAKEARQMGSKPALPPKPRNRIQRAPPVSVKPSSEQRESELTNGFGESIMQPRIRRLPGRRRYGSAHARETHVNANLLRGFKNSVSEVKTILHPESSP